MSKKIGYPVTKSGDRDMRYSMPCVLKNDGTADQRYNSFQKPEFGPQHVLTQGKSQYYNSVPVQDHPGVYLISTTNGGPGRPEQQYVGKDAHLGSRVNDHGRGGGDNIADLMQRAGNQGKTVMVQMSNATSRDEARAQEIYLLDNAHYSWNSQDNDGRFHGEKTADGRKRW